MDYILDVPLSGLLSFPEQCACIVENPVDSVCGRSRSRLSYAGKTRGLGGRNRGDVGERAFTRLKSAASLRAYKSGHNGKVFTTGATVRVSPLQGWPLRQ